LFSPGFFGSPLPLHSLNFYVPPPARIVFFCPCFLFFSPYSTCHPALPQFPTPRPNQQVRSPLLIPPFYPPWFPFSLFEVFFYQVSSHLSTISSCMLFFGFYLSHVPLVYDYCVPPFFLPFNLVTTFLPASLLQLHPFSHFISSGFLTFSPPTLEEGVLTFNPFPPPSFNTKDWCRPSLIFLHSLLSYVPPCSRFLQVPFSWRFSPSPQVDFLFGSV